MPDESAPSSDPSQPTAHGDQVADRRRKLNRLRAEFGIDPFGGRMDGLISLGEAQQNYDEEADGAHKADATVDRRPRVRVAGRVVQHRVMGNLIFLQLRDASGDLQAAVSKKAVPLPAFQMAKLTDLADLVVVEGPLAKTKTGEITVWAEGARDEGDRGPSESDASPAFPGFAIITKSLAPPPGKWHGLQDSELRYRHRYVDLWANPQVMRTMQLRIRIVEEIRQYMRGRGFLEVETPMLQPMHGGAAARPFETHHNALDMRLFLRIAPELYLKRLLVGGFPKVFEINRNFRNEGISPRHNPEFTMLEVYEAFGSWETMADLVEDMICTVAAKVLGTLRIEHRNAEGDVTRTIDLTRPWRRVRMAELVEERTGWKFQKRAATPSELRLLQEHIELRTYRELQRQAEKASPVFTEIFSPAPTIAEFEQIKPRIRAFLESKTQELKLRLASVELKQPDATKRGVPSELDRIEAELERVLDINEGFTRLDDQKRIEVEQDAFTLRFRRMQPAEQLVEVYEKLVEPTLIDPCFVTHVPSVVIPLARESREDPFFADVYELAINGVEISPGYSELNDPDVQEKHLRHQVGDQAEHQQVDEDFLNALRVGMPPAGGLGLGIDRLVMMLTGAESIRDVILFPLMRPQER